MRPGQPNLETKPAVLDFLLEAICFIRALASNEARNLLKRLYVDVSIVVDCGGAPSKTKALNFEKWFWGSSGVKTLRPGCRHPASAHPPHLILKL